MYRPSIVPGSGAEQVLGGLEPPPSLPRKTATALILAFLVALASSYQGKTLITTA